MSAQTLWAPVALTLAASIDLWVAWGSRGALLWIAVGVLWLCAAGAWWRALRGR